MLCWLQDIQDIGNFEYHENLAIGHLEPAIMNLQKFIEHSLSDYRAFKNAYVQTFVRSKRLIARHSCVRQIKKKLSNLCGKKIHWR